MKNAFYCFILFLMMGAMAQAQAFGAAGVEVEGVFNTKKPVYYDWLRMGNTRQVTMKFPQTVKGIEDALQFTEQMLVKNELSINQPDQYKSVEMVDTKSDQPAALHNAIQDDKRKVNLVWYAADGAALHLFLGPYSYEINIYNAFKIR
jgi:hypothetical protein